MLEYIKLFINEVLCIARFTKQLLSKAKYSYINFKSKELWIAEITKRKTPGVTVLTIPVIDVAQATVGTRNYEFKQTEEYKRALSRNNPSFTVRIPTPKFNHTKTTA